MASLPVWFDFENTPHVLFLEPLLRRVAVAGVPVWATAKPQAQTLELAEEREIPVTPVGRGDHATLYSKVAGGLARTAGLVSQARRQQHRPQLLVSSSRTASLAAWYLRLPAVSVMDYEHSAHGALTWSSRSIWLPDLLRDAALPAKTRRLARFFPGLKENLYLDQWSLSRETERARLGVSSSTYLVVARPPASTAHYASGDSMSVWAQAVTRLSQRSGVSVLVLCRTERQRDQVAQLIPAGSPVEILQRTVSGPSTIAAADLVVSGGGTMNREAAVLGVPAWSVFTGATPHIDSCLAEEGRLRWVRSADELEVAMARFPELLRPRRGPFPEGITAILGDIGELIGVRLG